MHKDFYASGFLYYPRTQQILLQQENTADLEPTWSLFGGDSSNGESSAEAFKRIIHSALRLDLKLNTICEIYSYFHEEKHKDSVVHYAKVRKMEKFAGNKNITYAWFTFKEIQKLRIPDKVKQDIIVGQRVIDSAIRRSLGQQTID
jgi:ADP-ribose pyrophosphatase YjhB (NUDIX family)